MSGGYFSYAQDHVEEIAVEITDIINCRDYEGGEDVRREFITGEYLLYLAHAYAQRIDWLVCADDGPAEFMLRLREEVGKVHDMMARRYGLRLRVELEEVE